MLSSVGPLPLGLVARSEFLVPSLTQVGSCNTFIIRANSKCKPGILAVWSEWMDWIWWRGMFYGLQVLSLFYPYDVGTDSLE